MKNIGVVVDNEFDNDIRVVTECKILKQNGFNVFVLCLGYNNIVYSDDRTDGIQIQRVKLNRKIKNILFAFNNTIAFYNLFWSFKINKFIQDYNIDFLHAHDLYMAKPAHKAASKENVKITLDLHENYPAAVKGYRWMYKQSLKLFIRPNKWTKIEERYLNYADNIVVLSESFKNSLQNKYESLKNKKFVIYPNVPNINEFNTYEIHPEILEKNTDDFILFYFGGISKRRGIYFALEALEELTKTHKNIKLLLIGPIDKAEKDEFLMSFIKPSISDNIIYYKWKDISLLPSYIKISDVCLSPIEKNDQHESGVANKIFQYMLFERPIIVSNCTPQEKIVNEEYCGLVHIHNNANDLANKILEL